MKSIFLILSLLFFAALMANAQKKERIDVIYLKSDSILKGNITDSIPGISITVQTLDDDYHFVPREDILKIEKEVYLKSAQELKQEREISYANRKGTNYWLWIRGGGGLSLDNGSPDVGNIDMVNGIRLDDDFCLGIGIGTRFQSGGMPFLVPIYVQLQSPIIQKRIAPMISVATGMVATPSSNWIIGAPLIRADVGLQFYLGAEDYFTVTVGYERLNFLMEKRSYEPADILTTQTITFNLGLMF